MIAVSRAVSVKALAKSLKLSSRSTNTPTTSAYRDATPAASVGVKIPDQIPPSRMIGAMSGTTASAKLLRGRCHGRERLARIVVFLRLDCHPDHECGGHEKPGDDAAQEEAAHRDPRDKRKHHHGDAGRENRADDRRGGGAGHGEFGRIAAFRHRLVLDLPEPGRVHHRRSGHSRKDQAAQDVRVRRDRRVKTRPACRRSGRSAGRCRRCS